MHNLFSLLLSVALLLSLGSTAGVVFLYGEVKEENTRVSAQIQNLLSIVEGQQALSNALQAELRGEQESRIEAEQETEAVRATLETQLSALRSDISLDRERAEASDISKIISAWSPRVGKVLCVYGSSGEAQSRGSAVAFLKDGVYQFLTNAHVVRKDEYGVATECAVALGSDTFSFKRANGQIVAQSSEDVGFLILSAPPSASAFKSLPLCTKDPVLGDPLVILGYPAIGSAESITVTEGIVSGFEKNYYITSAKIDRGSSGGAAIDVKGNCFAGIPTLVTVSSIESLARVLAAKHVF